MKPGPSPAPVPALEARSLSVRHPGSPRPSLQELSAAFPAGRFTAVAGPNGSGKSTLLRALIGLPASPGPGDGTVLLYGTPIGEIPPRRRARQLSLMPQTAPDGLGLTLEQVAAGGLYPWKTRFSPPAPAEKALLRETLNRLEILPLAGRPFSSLSTGEKQRGLFARTLMQQTPAVLLDEPTASLDLRHQEALLSTARALTAEGRTVIAAVHDLNAAVRWADQLLVLQEGRAAAFGPPALILNKPLLQEVWQITPRLGRHSATGRWMLDTESLDQAPEDR